MTLKLREILILALGTVGVGLAFVVPHREMNMAFLSMALVLAVLALLLPSRMKPKGEEKDLERFTRLTNGTNLIVWLLMLAFSAQMVGLAVSFANDGWWFFNAAGVVFVLVLLPGAMSRREGMENALAVMLEADAQEQGAEVIDVVAPPVVTEALSPAKYGQRQVSEGDER